MAELKSNAGKIYEELKRGIQKIPKAVQRDLQSWGNKTIKRGLRYKEYSRRSGNLDRAQKADVEGLTLRIYIDPTQVTTTTKSGKTYNYGTIQHDGAPKRNIKGDPWLERAVDKGIDDLTKQISDTIVGLL